MRETNSYLNEMYNLEKNLRVHIPISRMLLFLKTETLELCS